MAISSAYKSSTVSSVSGTTFNSSGSIFAAGDVGRLIILTSGSGKLQHRKIVTYNSATQVVVDHPWDTNPFVDSVNDVAPSASNTFVVSYLQSDATFTGEAGVTVSGEQIDISALNLTGGAYIHITNAQVDLDSAGVEIGVGAGMIFGWYEYIAGEDAQVRDSCHIIDRTTSGLVGNQMGRGTTNGADFGMLDIYGGTILANQGTSTFWRCYYDTSASDCQARWINIQCFGQNGLGCRIDGNRSIVLMTQVGATNAFGPCNVRDAVSRVSISAIDCEQAAYVWTYTSGGGPNGRLVFPRLSNLGSRVIRSTNSTAHDSDTVMEVIAKKSEIDAAPTFVSNVDNTLLANTHTTRFGNIISPSFYDEYATIITNSIKTTLKDATTTTVNTETLTTGAYTPYFARHTDLVFTTSTALGDYSLSDGTQYAPYVLSAILYERNILTQSISVEDLFNAPLTMLPDLLITQTTKATVDAYTTIDDAYELYDRAKSYLYDNFAGETVTIISRSAAQAVLGAKNLTINSAAGSVFAYSGSTITIKSNTFTGGATSTTGSVTVSGATALSGGTFDCDVIYSSSATTLTNITCSTDVWFTVAGTYTLSGCTLNGVRNLSGGAVTLILTNGSTVAVNLGPSLTIEVPVLVRVTVTDASGSPIQNARVYVEAGATGPAAQGTVIFNALTNASGIVENTAYNFQGTQSLQNGRVRKGSSSPYYQPSSFSGSITNNGLDINVILIGDE